MSQDNRKTANGESIRRIAMDQGQNTEDFEDQLREIDTTIGDMASKESQAMEEFSDSLAIQLDDVVAKSGGLGVTLSSGSTKSGPPSKVSMVTPSFVLGPGDVITKTLSSGKKNVKGATKKTCTSAKDECGKMNSKGTWKRLKKSQISEEVVMGDQNEISKRKLEALEDTRKDALVLAKRLKLEDAVSLGKGLFVPSDGKSGGLALLWKPDVKVDIQMVSRWHIEAFIDSGETILSIPLSIRMPRDKMVWAGTPNGKFTVKSAYWLAKAMSTADHEGTSARQLAMYYFTVISPQQSGRHLVWWWIGTLCLWIVYGSCVMHWDQLM
ncbi:hypothetical protein CMV_030299 [Castanea mollissima]|uniref:Uncharacterized protein n=1 Tax=Castanea mollissima TaxID=60419 RepID=A0A8J4UYG6_9ROSI|nr:hypothetical protein CMV_030299 [Castanea mollissima]